MKTQGLSEVGDESSKLRTELAEERTVSANEHTIISRLGAALSSIGGGLAVTELIRRDVQSVAAKIVGIIFAAILFILLLILPRSAERCRS